MINKLFIKGRKLKFFMIKYNKKYKGCKNGNNRWKKISNRN